MPIEPMGTRPTDPPPSSERLRDIDFHQADLPCGFKISLTQVGEVVIESPRIYNFMEAIDARVLAQGVLTYLRTNAKEIAKRRREFR